MAIQQKAAQPVRNERLVSVFDCIKALHNMSKNKASFGEIAHALAQVYNPSYLLYDSMAGEGLSWPIDGTPNVENSGYNLRGDIICAIFNSRFWKNENFVQTGSGDYEMPDIEICGLSARKITLNKEDSVSVCSDVWRYLFPEIANMPPLPFDEHNIKQENKTIPDYLDPGHPRFSYRLAAAVRAWQAVEDTKGKSVKDALTSWLEMNYKSLELIDRRNGEKSQNAIDQIAQIVNWNAKGGATRTPGTD